MSASGWALSSPQAVTAGLRSPRTIPHGNGIDTMTAELDEDSGIRLLVRERFRGLTGSRRADGPLIWSRESTASADPWRRCRHNCASSKR